MSDENKFFRFVWRFNALALAVAVLFALGSAGYEQWRRYNYDHIVKPVGGFAPVPKAAEKDATYRLEVDGYISGLTLKYGTAQERLLPLKRWEGAPQSYGLMAMRLADSRSAGGIGLDAVNLLIIDAATGKSRWMFNGYKRQILSVEVLYETEPSTPAYSGIQMPPAVGAVLRVVERDTNGDGKLTSDDTPSLYVYRPGTQPLKLLSADTIVTIDQVASDKLLVVYEDGSSAYAATYAMTDFKLISQESLPKVPQ